MASVYAGTHRNGARAAIKVLHAQYTRNEQARRRFLAEGYAANKVGHRNAVSVLDDDITEDGEVYLVMELLEGESFEGRLDRVGVMSPIEVLQITEQMLEVLACAHTRGILHRDIKPANVFLCRDGSVKLLDFGLARVRELSAEALDQSDGIVFGTVSYIAPEQARADNQNLDARSDMWSVAATMFRALTGETVFPAEGPVIERLMAVARKPARSLAHVDPRLPRLIVELVDRALAFEPDNRWPSANVMRVVVQDVLAQLTEEAEEAAAAVAADEAEIRLNTSVVFRKQPDSAPTSTRPRSDPALSPARPKPDVATVPSRPAAPMRPRTDPALAQPQRSQRPKTDPFGIMPDDVRGAGEPSPSPVPDDADEMDLDVESMEGPSSKKGRTRTLLTKEGRAELRRILDARRTTKAKGDPTPEPVHMPTPTPALTPTPTPTPAPVQVESLVQVSPRVITQPSAEAQPVQPRPRTTTEPSPVAAPVQPRPRVKTEPSPVAPPHEFISPDSSMVMTIEEDASMLESGMVVMQPEESIIEVTIQHTRPGTGGPIAEPLADATSRPGPGDSLTTAAFPAIGTPRTGGPPVTRAPGVALPAGSENSRVGPAPTPETSSKTTASYPTIGGLPPAPSKSTASYAAVGAMKPPTKGPPGPAPQRSTEPARPTADEVTKIGAVPQPPPGAVRPVTTGETSKAPAPARPDEPAGEVTKVTRVPLPTFGRPATTPTGPTPGPLPSRAVAPPQSPVSGEIGDADRKPLSSSGRWAPPTKSFAPGEAKPEPTKVAAPPVKAEPVKAEPVKAEPVKAEPVKAEPVKVVSPVAKPVPISKPLEVKPSPAKVEPSKPLEGLKPTTPVAKVEPGKPIEQAKPVAKVEPSKPIEPVKLEPRAPTAKPLEVKAPISKSIEAAKPEPMKVPVSAKPEAAVSKPVVAAKPEPLASKPAGPKPEVATKPVAVPEVKAPAVPVTKTEPVKVPAPVKSEVAIKADAPKPVVKPEAVKAEPSEPPIAKPAEVAVPEPTPAPESAADPLRLPGAGLSRPAPTKSVFSVPYAGLGKDRGDKATSKSEPAEPAKGTPKKSS